MVVNHRNIRLGDLLGHFVEMKRRPAITGGTQLQCGRPSWGVFRSAFEMAAFERWRKKLSRVVVDREFAQQWRNSLAALDLAAIFRIVRNPGRAEG